MSVHLSCLLWEPEPLCFVDIGMAFQSLQIGTKKAAFSVPTTRRLKGRTPAELDPVHPFNDLAGFLRWWWANSMKLPHISFCWAMWSTVTKMIQEIFLHAWCFRSYHFNWVVPRRSLIWSPNCSVRGPSQLGVSFSTNLWFVQLDLSSLTLLVVVHSPGDADDFLQTTYSTKVYESPFYWGSFNWNWFVDSFQGIQEGMMEGRSPLLDWGSYSCGGLRWKKKPCCSEGVRVQLLYL